jgi:hypothetical protein
VHGTAREGGRVTTLSRARQAAVVEELRAKLAAHPRTATAMGRPAPTLPVASAFTDLFPDKGLRKGASYAIRGTTGSTALTFALMAEVSRSGTWCGVVGMPGFGAEAASELGVDLSRVVLVPTPGRHWLTVSATLIDVLDLVVVRPPTRPTDTEIARLAARMRERGSILLVHGTDWPGCELRLEVTSSTWHGLGDGHGHLTARQVTVEATGRATDGVRRTTRLWLPGPDGSITPVDAGSESVDEHVETVGVGPEVIHPRRRPLVDLSAHRWERAG